MRLFITLILSNLLLISSVGQGFRGMIPIASPDDEKLEQGQQTAPVQSKPVSRKAAEQVLKQLIQAWNDNELDSKLSDSFYDKSRLVDTLNSEVPKDARLVLLSVQSVQTLQQYVEEHDTFGRVLVSRVSAIAQTQVEFNDPQTGEFVRREGENEFIVLVKQRAK